MTWVQQDYYKDLLSGFQQDSIPEPSAVDRLVELALTVGTLEDSEELLDALAELDQKAFDLYENVKGRLFNAG